MPILETASTRVIDELLDKSLGPWLPRIQTHIKNHMVQASTDKTVCVFSVLGAPGSGKTSLANNIHEEIYRHDPEAQVGRVTYSIPVRTAEAFLGLETDDWLITQPEFLLGWQIVNFLLRKQIESHLSSGAKYLITDFPGIGLHDRAKTTLRSFVHQPDKFSTLAIPLVPDPRVQDRAGTTRTLAKKLNRLGKENYDHLYEQLLEISRKNRVTFADIYGNPILDPDHATTIAAYLAQGATGPEIKKINTEIAQAAKDSMAFDSDELSEVGLQLPPELNKTPRVRVRVTEHLAHLAFIQRFIGIPINYGFNVFEHSRILRLTISDDPLTAAEFEAQKVLAIQQITHGFLQETQPGNLSETLFQTVLRRHSREHRRQVRSHRAALKNDIK